MYTNIAHWYVQKNKRSEALAALSALADRVQRSEPDTWAYIIHTGADQSLPPVGDDEIIFIEIYKDIQAFLGHIHGAAYVDFIKDHGNLFVQVPPSPISPKSKPPGQPFFLAEHVERHAGFIRPDAC